MKSTPFFLLGLALTACLGVSTLTTDAADTNAAPAAVAGQPPVVTVKELIQSPAKLDGQQIVLEGFVTDYCKRKGCWAMLHDPNADAKGLVKVQQNEEGPTFKPFLPELQGKTILVTGTVHATKVDTNYLDKWEARVKSAAPAPRENAVGAADPDKAVAANLRQITALRERLAKSRLGYLTSVSFAAETWQAKPE